MIFGGGEHWEVWFHLLGKLDEEVLHCRLFIGKVGATRHQGVQLIHFIFLNDIPILFWMTSCKMWFWIRYMGKKAIVQRALNGLNCTWEESYLRLSCQMVWMFGEWLQGNISKILWEIYHQLWQNIVYLQGMEPIHHGVESTAPRVMSHLRMCETHNVHLYVSFIGIWCWLVELGSVDITCEVSMRMLSHIIMPMDCHLAHVFYIFSYLNQHHSLRLICDPTYPDIDMILFKWHKWNVFYGDVKE